MTLSFKKKIQTAVSVVMAVLIPNIVRAAEMADPSLGDPVPYPSMGNLFFRIIISLAFILFLTYLVLKLLKRQNALQLRQKSWIRIYDYQALGTNRGIYLMEMFSRIYLVAVAEGQVNILREIDDNDEEWIDLRESIQVGQDEDILPWGLGRVLKERWRMLRPGNPLDEERIKGDFSQQLQRADRLFRQVSKGGKDGE